MAKALDAHCLGLAGDLFERTAQHVGGGNFGCRVIGTDGSMNGPALDTRFDRTGNFNRGSTQPGETLAVVDRFTIQAEKTWRLASGLHDQIVEPRGGLGS